MNPDSQINSWLKHVDQYDFINALHDKGLSKPIDMNTDHLKAKNHIKQAYSKIHNYFKKNKKLLTCKDAKCVEELANHITSVGFHMNCNDPNVMNLYSIASILKNLNDTQTSKTFTRSEPSTGSKKPNRKDLTSLKFFESGDFEPLSLSKKDRIEMLKTNYHLLKSKKMSAMESYAIPKRRVCNISCVDSVRSLERAKEAIFATEEEIINVYPMRFLSDSPFVREEGSKWVKSIEDEGTLANLIIHLQKQTQAIAVTAQGKHVILQQALKSCVPTCMAMLILDRGKQPNYEAIEVTSLANNERAIKWAKEAGLVCRISEMPEENTMESLSKCLIDNGPGMLTVDHPTLGGHAIILDEISIERNEAVIRDPFHGWMITLKLDVLNTWECTTFLQIL